jgi:hypothetical protein
VPLVGVCRRNAVLRGISACFLRAGRRILAVAWQPDEPGLLPMLGVLSPAQGVASMI